MTENKSLHAGHGRIACVSHASSVVFTELSATYPLKLLSPKLVQDSVAIVYVLSYGGGLVNGDHVKLGVDVKDGCRLLLLSQGSTKVFKTRRGDRPSTRLGQPAHGTSQNVTTSVIEATVAPGSALFLLPDPVTCFRAASYSQTQRITLSSGASLILLDWVTSGRKSLGEEWVFSRYHSLNEVFLDGHCLARDIMLLEGPPQVEIPSIQCQGLSRTLEERLKPYSCYATLIFAGPLVQDIVTHLDKLYRSTTVFKATSPPRMTWALSPISEGKGHILRAAGVETEDVKDWLRESLRGFEDIVGVDTYPKLFV
ncbi:UreD urease accessory protein-domain-containing protein [Boletus coccyginus]|nr:UreD urease accessory protein-domain-containing protein [Boletus coccyginus]